MTNDMSVVLNFITVVFPNLILNVVVIVGSIYFLLKISLPLTLMSLCLFPILLFVVVLINNKMEEYYTNYQEGLGAISSRISHRFKHIRLMKAFNGEDSEQSAMSYTFDRLTNNFKKIIGLSSIQNTLVNGLMIRFIILLLVVAGMEVSKGSMTMSTLMTFIL
ncbi:ABC transporter transmembrane domain-containing protein, partial [Streptococcus pluranimalium]|uniref:ABC transporter transmembrane domain-containing protein n=1 Tax=Streptococcus pluranimalium TaxID=82348 RepID=UPI0039FCB41F